MVKIKNLILILVIFAFIFSGCAPKVDTGQVDKLVIESDELDTNMGEDDVLDTTLDNQSEIETVIGEDLDIVEDDIELGNLI
ncbi:MAG: hypothetical protein PF569_09975 [Candidatus Woesearchaeota archaeon]|jgi:hypothetical protein|nr:hypothetical protein [Candidatus Woesearchaeota archaeon]